MTNQPAQGAPMHSSPITHHLSRFLVVLACVLLAGGCAKMSGIGVTTLKSANLADLQGYLLRHRPDLDNSGRAGRSPCRSSSTARYACPLKSA